MFRKTLGRGFTDKTCLRGSIRVMTSIDAYIFKTTLASFAVILGALTGVIWITQALRGIDLMTSQGQTVAVFLGITGLAIPLLVLIIAPIALVIAVGHTLNRLSTDSELIVMNAAGMTPWQIFRPFLMVTVVVSILVAFVAAYLAPEGMRRLKRWDMEITADVVANILQPGRFTSIGDGLTLRVREKRPGGLLSNIFVDDRRDPKERVSIMADHGTVLKNDKGTFIILEDGTLQRFEAGQRDPAIVAFDRYAFDMSKYSNMSRDVAYTVRERYLWELFSPKPGDPVLAQGSGQVRAEFHDRLTAPLYPFVFVFVTFAFLGAPRTTRQSRGFSVVNAILAVSAIRMIGFATAVLATTSALAPPAQYLLLAIVVALSSWVIGRGVVIDSPALIMETVTRWFDRLTESIRGPVGAST
jgi:lipopolysaccharide export system permease protein